WSGSARYRCTWTKSTPPSPTATCSSASAPPATSTRPPALSRSPTRPAPPASNSIWRPPPPAMPSAIISTDRPRGWCLPSWRRCWPTANSLKLSIQYRRNNSIIVASSLGWSPSRHTLVICPGNQARLPIRFTLIPAKKQHMTDIQVEDLNIESQQPLITPRELKSKLPLSDSARATVAAGRQAVRDILDRKDHRLFIVIGPCSIHDTKAALEYATRLKALSEKVKDTIQLVLRVYFEKPRTTVGWKGLINDPYMNDTFKIEDGLNIARQLLLDVAEMGLPAATEALDPITPQYLQDLITWSAIGARTTESQTHREMSSGLSGPVGFKNGTDGSLEVAVNAMLSVKHPHRFLGIDNDGRVALTTTRGNQYGHVVLRGGGGKPNYDSVSVALAE